MSLPCGVMISRAAVMISRAAVDNCRPPPPTAELLPRVSKYLTDSTSESLPIAGSIASSFRWVVASRLHQGVGKSQPGECRRRCAGAGMPIAEPTVLQLRCHTAFF